MSWEQFISNMQSGLEVLKTEWENEVPHSEEREYLLGKIHELELCIEMVVGMVSQ